MDGGTLTTAEAARTVCLDPEPPQLGSPNPHAQDDQTVAQWARQTNGQVQDEQWGRQANGQAQDGDGVDEEPSDPTNPKMRARPRMTIGLSADPMDVLFDRKLSIEDPSPKPYIVPGNALHLIDDDPSPRSQTPSSVIILEPDDATDPPADADRSSSEPPPARAAPRVRFRSRVRITSGVHRSRPARTHANATPSSSASDSPSSSISAPLRYQADENTAWGPLGKRLSSYASTGGWQKRAPVPPTLQAGAGTRTRTGADVQLPDERTPLVQPARRSTSRNVRRDDAELFLHEAVEDEDQNEAEREQVAVFGPWPRRLLNRHWWWWHLEPVLCCLYCSDDSDYDE